MPEVEGDILVQELHREMANTIRQTLTDPEMSHRSRESAALFSRKAADLLKADYPTFSNQWFFGAGGLDSWGELLPAPEFVR